MTLGDKHVGLTFSSQSEYINAERALSRIDKKVYLQMESITRAYKDKDVPAEVVLDCTMKKDSLIIHESLDIIQVGPGKSNDENLPSHLVILLIEGIHTVALNIVTSSGTLTVSSAII